MSTNERLEKINGVIASAIYKIYSQDIRAVLDEELHFMPLDLESISTILKDKLDQDREITDLYNDILNYFITSTGPNKKLPISKKLFLNSDKTFTTEKGVNLKSEIELKEKISPKSKSYKYLSALVYDKSEKLIGVLAPSFDSISRNVITNLFNDKLKGYLEEYKTKYKNKEIKISEGYDIGHIFFSTERTYGLDPRTPATEKTSEVINYIEKTLQGISEQEYPERRAALSSMLKGITTRFDLLKQHSTYAPKILLNIDKDFSEAALHLKLKINVVIPQDRYENQAIYAALHEGPLVRYIFNELIKLNFSRNLVEETAARVVHAIKGTVIKDTKASIKSVSKDSILNITTGKALSTGTLKVQTKSKGRSGVSNTASLASLQNLINQNLAEQIKGNMGSGERRDVLNYRTGRFAESTKVEHMSQSREGMISAFYSYMKYPYATFSEGGAQSAPRTRDPKLLISKSIREIGAQLVSNRMRAIVV